LKALILKTSRYAVWPSLKDIQKAFYDFLSQQSLLHPAWAETLDKKTDFSRYDCVVFPPGTADVFGFEALRQLGHLQTLPPCFFFLTGEAAKAGSFLFHYQAHIRRCDHIIVASRAEKACLQSFFPDFENFHVMYFPLSSAVSKMKKAKSKCSAEQMQQIKINLGLPPARKLVLYAGRISRQKQVLRLIEKWGHLSKFDLVIAGQSDNLGWPHFGLAEKKNYLQEINSYIRKTKCTQVHFLGQLSQRELFELFSIVDGQVSASIHFGEDFGYSIAQGLAFDLPTSITAWGGHLEWIQKGFAKGIDVGGDLSIQIPASFKPMKSLKKGSFLEFYQKEVCRQWGHIFSSEEASIHLKASKEISEFHSQLAKSKRGHLFEHLQNPIYQKIKKTYLGK
jgi:glycosyltransferase involved in cell wall biosynthesis